MNSHVHTEEVLTPGEVAELFGVHPRTLVRWATANKVACIRTLGGHRRYLKKDIDRLLDARTKRAEHEARVRSGAVGRGW